MMRELWRRRRLRRLHRLASRGTYAYRGERERQAKRRRRLALVAGLCATAVIVFHERTPAVATAAPVRPAPVARLLARERAVVAKDVPAPRFTPAVDSGPHVHRAVTRWNRVYRFASRYGISTDLAGAIHDAAVAEGLEPELAFRLVQTESEFNERATSPVGAVGLTQLMPRTARYFAGAVTRNQLYDRHLNLRVGFRYLRGLIREYKSLRLALLVYNRGPVAVEAALNEGRDPANGYETVVTKGYRGRGTID
jgi:soluble lytic murein transglycosylase-like protein